MVKKYDKAENVAFVSLSSHVSGRNMSATGERIGREFKYPVLEVTRRSLLCLQLHGHTLKTPPRETKSRLVVSSTYSTCIGLIYQNLHIAIIIKMLPKDSPQPSNSENLPSKPTNMALTTKSKSKSKSSTGTTRKPASKPKPTKPRPAPLPATVEVRGYEITIPNIKTCWHVSVLHSCGHPVLEEVPVDVRYPGCDKPLVAEISRHSVRACTDKCKVEAMDHVLVWMCDVCRRLKGDEAEKMDRVYDGLPMA